MREQYNLTSSDLLDTYISGKELMENGLDIGSLYSTIDKESFKGVFSRLIYLIGE